MHRPPYKYMLPSIIFSYTKTKYKKKKYTSFLTMAGMNMMTMKGLLCATVVFMVVAPRYVDASLSCNTVTTNLAPCVDYLMSGGSVSSACCDGVNKLNAEAQTTTDRKTACNCMKSSYKSIPGINANNAASLPGKCGVNIPYQISLSTNCNSYVKLYTSLFSFIS